VSTYLNRFGLTGWLLVLVYFGALTAISGYISHWFLLNAEISFFEVFVEVIISTLVLFLLSRIYSALRQRGNSIWWSRGLKILAVIFCLIGLTYLGLGLALLFSLDEYKTDPNFAQYGQDLQQTVIRFSYFYGILLTASSVIAFVATVGVSIRRKFGWYVSIALVIVQIVSVTGLLDRERATHFILPPEIANKLTPEEIAAIEEQLVPVVMNTIFAILIANIVIVTFLILPQILAIFKMPPNILSSRIGKVH